MIALEKIPNYGDHMKMEEFIRACKANAFIDSDGIGCYATDTAVTQIYVAPSEVVAGKFNWKWSHVVWFNK